MTLSSGSVSVMILLSCLFVFLTPTVVEATSKVLKQPPQEGDEKPDVVVASASSILASSSVSNSEPESNRKHWHRMTRVKQSSNGDDDDDDYYFDKKTTKESKNKWYYYYYKPKPPTPTPKPTTKPVPPPPTPQPTSKPVPPPPTPKPKPAAPPTPKATTTPPGGGSSTHTDGDQTKDGLQCFTSPVEAGALGSMVLASLWYEIAAVAPSCNYNSVKAVVQRFFTPDVTIQDRNGQLLTTDAHETLSYLMYGEFNPTGQPVVGSFLHLCQSMVGQPDYLVSWQTYQTYMEPNIYDDFVWGGNLHLTPLHSDAAQELRTSSLQQQHPPWGRYFFIELGGHRGGHTLQGYNMAQREFPPAACRECYQPIIYGVVYLDTYDDATSSTNDYFPQQA